MKHSQKILFGSIAVAVLLIGALAGYLFWNKAATEHFLADFNTLNAPYKQALFQTGQGNRDESVANYNAFTRQLSDFRTKYASGTLAVKNKASFDASLIQVQIIVDTAREDVTTGNLTRAHTTLEGIRPIFTDILRTNELSLLSVALVDFHDSMEPLLDAANDQDSAIVLERYDDADAKLRAVEAELNDSSVQTIRVRLEALKAAAESGKAKDLPALGASLKTGYVKVYLAEG